MIIMKSKVHTKTLKIRIRDKHLSTLNKWAYGVNQVWNFCNETAMKALSNVSEFGPVKPAFLSGYDLQKHTKGMNKTLGLNSATVQMVGHEYATRRRQFKKYKLNWRKSGGVRRSLGWLPVRKDCIGFKNGQVYHNRHYFSLAFGIVTDYLNTRSNQAHSMRIKRPVVLQRCG